MRSLKVLLDRFSHNWFGNRRLFNMAQKWLAVNYDNAWCLYSPHIMIWQDFAPAWQGRFRAKIQQFLSKTLASQGLADRAITAIFELATNIQRHAMQPATQMVLELGFVYGVPTLRLIDNASPFNGFYNFWAQADQTDTLDLHGLGWVKKLFPFTTYKTHTQFGEVCNAVYLPFYAGADSVLPAHFHIKTDNIFRQDK
jgi:hypothetical protein